MLGLIAIDVDGTLVGLKNTVRDDVWAALAHARAQGVHLALCSGRPAVGDALAYAQRLDPDGWHIFQNGASVVQVDTGESLSEPFPADAVTHLAQRSQETGWLLEVYTDTEYALTPAGPLAQQHAELLGVPYSPRPIAELTGTPVRAQWVVTPEQTAPAQAEHYPGLSLHPATTPSMPGITFISLTRAGVTKGSGIARIAAQYGVPLERTMMVGDGHNDVEAMKVVGYPVAMGNADPHAKKAARFHVGHVDEGGLIEAIELALKS